MLKIGCCKEVSEPHYIDSQQRLMYFFYTCGKYVEDGKFDPNCVDQQPGVAVLLNEIMS